MIQKQVFDTKKCASCGGHKNVFDFALRNTEKGIRHLSCKDCFNEKCRGKYKGSEAYNREKNLKKKYGITEAIYQEMFIDQGGKCKICSTHQIDLKHKLQVDHCHATGSVRALLCFNCNRGLGSFRDNIEWINIAAKYLEDYLK